MSSLTYSVLSILAEVLPFLRVFRSDGEMVAGGAASGIFCLFDRRPEDPDCDVLGVLLSLDVVLRFRDDGGTGGWIGTSAAAGAAGDAEADA